MAREREGGEGEKIESRGLAEILPVRAQNSTPTLFISSNIHNHGGFTNNAAAGLSEVIN